MPFKPLPRFGALLIAVALGLSLACVVFGVQSLAASRDSDLELALIRSRNLAESIDQNLSSTLERVDLVLRTVVGELEASQGPRGLDLPRIKRLIATEATLIPEALAIRVTDAQGRVLLGNPGPDPRVSLAGLPPFGQLRVDPAAGTQVTHPIQDPFTLAWTLTSGRRYIRPDGGFAGMVAIPVTVEYLRQRLSGFNIGSGGTLTLRDSDLGFITRNPLVLKGRTLALGDRTVSPEFEAFARSGRSKGSYLSRTPFDQTRRTFTVHRLRAAPMFVLAGLAEEDTLAQWRLDRNATVTVIAALLLAIWITAALAWHSWKTHARDNQAILASQQRASSLLEAIPDRMFRLDPAGTFLDYQAEAGQPPAAAQDKVGRSCYEDLPPAFRDRMRQRLEAALAMGRLQTFEYQRPGPDGGVRHFEARMIRSGDQEVTAIVRDLTERVLADQTRTHLQEKLQQAQKMENLGNLAGGIAHDMNNVLGAILGQASAAVEGTDAGTADRRAFETIIRAAERGGKMVRSLLTFARQSPAELHDLDMNDLLREQAHLMEHTTLARIQVQLDLAADLRSLRGDPGALTHLLMNLCVNAVDAMPGAGTLTLRTRNAAPAWVEVQVEDTGCGMPKEVLARALDPFYTTKDIGKGTGLGLALVYSTVTAHRGLLEIQSEPGQGTRVTLRFPACEPEAPPAAASPTLPAAAPALRVLVVDDDEMIQTSMQAILEVLGHHGTAAASGEEALGLLEAGLVPEVVILDLNMPGLGGAGTLPRLSLLCPQVPVLLCTGRADQVALELVATYPQATLLPKPFTIRQLQERLDALRP